jgi:AcrR family transcriptional regulator
MKKDNQRTKAPLGRRERRRLETREKLYRTAMELFAKRGYFETTTEDITEAADVGQGTFFNYFPTKSHVLLALSEKQLGKVHAAAEAAERAETSVREVFGRFIHSIVEELAKSQALARSLLTIFVSEKDVRVLMGNTLTAGRDGIARICEIGQQRGELRQDRKAADLAMTFQRNVLGTLLIWTMQGKSDLHVWLDKTLTDFWDMAAAAKRDC